jgi:hypothetical protein
MMRAMPQPFKMSDGAIYAAISDKLQLKELEAKDAEITRLRYICRVAADSLRGQFSSRFEVALLDAAAITSQDNRDG